VGTLLLHRSAAGLQGVYWTAGAQAKRPERHWQKKDDAFAVEKEQLAEYFAGRRSDFDLSLAPQGTLFQSAVWAALADIPYGQTRTYAELAQYIGRPRAARPVGSAIGRNPLAIIVPCHRVIGSNGALVGFAGGIDNKRALLCLEGKHADALDLAS